MNMEIHPNECFNYQLEIDRAFKNLSSKKAVGLNFIPDLLFKIKDSEAIKNRIRSHFKDYLIAWKNPSLFYER